MQTNTFFLSRECYRTPLRNYLSPTPLKYPVMQSEIIYIITGRVLVVSDSRVAHLAMKTKQGKKKKSPNKASGQ